MPIYVYKAMNLEGKTQSGEIEARDEIDLKLLLKKEGLMVLSHKIKVNKKPSFMLELRSKPKKEDVVLFIRQLSIMVSAGIPVEDAVRTINEQTSSVALKKVLIQIEEEMYEGSLLSDAFAKFPKIFPNYFRNIIYIGELSGNLPSVLLKAADYYEKDAKTKRKTKSAMAYPMFLFVLIIAVFIFLVLFIVPNFENTLTEMGAELPSITKLVLAISDFFSNNYLKLIGGVIGGILFLFIWFKTKSGRYVKDFLKLKLPIIGKVTYYLITSRFANGLSVLVSSGMSVMDSIEIIGKLMDNVVFERKFQYVIDEIKSGKKIHQSIEYINFFPKMLVEMVNVGESTGSLEEVLHLTSIYYDEQLEITIQKASASLEPIMIMMAAGIVGFVLLAVMLPMLQIAGSVDV